MIVLSIYQDAWSRWHDKKCNNMEPSSNNGWFYTALAVKLGLHVRKDLLEDCFVQCWKTSKTLYMNRSPGKKDPPMSRDEILGLKYLKFIFIPKDCYDRGFEGWEFSPYPIPNFNLIKTYQAIWRMRKAHRNAIWEGKGEPHLWRFAFSVPIQDRRFLLQESELKPNIFYTLYEKIANLLPPSDSGRFIRFLKGTYTPSINDFIKVFGEDHPFTERAKILYA